jgi:fatty acid desaturase
MSVFKHKIDLLPTLHALCVALTQLTLYVWIESPAWLLVAGLLMTPVCFLTVPITHNHFHVPIFNRQPLNRAIELILFFQNGFTEGSWKPTHNLHHAHYLNRRSSPERRDPNSWVDAPTGHKLKLRQYVFPFMLGHWKRHPSMSFSRLRRGSSWEVRLVRLLVMLGLILVHPFAACCLFLGPMAISQVLTAVHSYYQHAGLDTDDPYAASFNYHSPFYLYNIGYHTAHHLKPRLHWSKLPVEHRQIEGRIPAQNMVSCYLSLSKYTDLTPR